MATYEGLVKLGTLRNGTTIKPRPTLPWRISAEPYAGAGVGNIADFNTDPVITNWNIGDTDVNDANKLQWHKIKDGAKTLLICDRVILVSVSWDDLHGDNRVFGKTITIDGQQYKLRLLTGGSNYRSGTGGYSGGTPTSNEWDRFITNEDAIAGFPIPASSDLDTTLNSTDKNSAHNQFWNWMGVYSWAQETYTGNSANRAVRGYNSARYWSIGSATGRSYGIGWRPVLEVLNSAPSVTLTDPANNQVLTEGNTYDIAGSATDTDNGNVVTIKYKINNGTERAIASGVSDGSTPLSFAKTLTYQNKRLWDGATDVTGVDLAENTAHTLHVWVEDDQGGVSTEEVRNFTVIWNRPPTISGANEDLGTIMAPPVRTYTVTDPEGNPFMITEKINGTVIRSFPGVTGQEETVTIPHDRWIRLDLDTPHELTVEATDDNGLTSTRTFTFVRTETHIEFMLDFDNPDVEVHFTLDGMPKRVLVKLERYLPPGSEIEFVRVTNNAMDAEPTWEDATAAVIAGRGHLFTNETKTAESWRINIWVSIAKGTATERVLLNGYGGAFD